MNNKSHQLDQDCPEFLKQKFDARDRTILEKAYAKYIRDLNKTPKQAVIEKVSMKMLLPNLQEIDERWENIPPAQMKTSLPRVKIHRMNLELGRWKEKFDVVQKVIDELSDEPEPTEPIGGNS